ENRLAFFTQLQERLRAMPGVISASAATIVPLDGHTGYFYRAENGRKLTEKDGTPVGLTIFALPRYLETMGLTLKSGRDFNEPDTQIDAKAKVAVVNETFARFFFGTTDVVGRRICWPADKPDWFEITGVIKDNRHYGLDLEVRPEVLLPFAANTATSGFTFA